MKSFRQFQEAIRSPERAKKLVNYMDDRWGTSEGIPHHHWEYPGDPVPHFDKEMFDYKGIQDVPVHHLTAGQAKVTPEGMHHYLDGKGDIDHPIHVIKHPRGNLILHDGHHRLMVHKLLGRKTIKAHVYNTTDKWKDNDEEY